MNTFSGANSGTGNGNLAYANTYSGANSGQVNVNGGYNTFSGAYSGWQNKLSGNTFMGYGTGAFNNGNYNTYYGYLGGINNNNGNSNIYLGHFGTPESNTIRIGMMGSGNLQQNRVFFDPILLHNAAAGDKLVSISPTGQLGVSPSSVLSGSCPPGPGGFFITQWLSLNTIGCSPIFHQNGTNNIGIGTTSPSEALDVKGAINASLWYDITPGQNTVLSIDNISHIDINDYNLFVGVFAGSNNDSSLGYPLGIANTFVGSYAGNSNDVGYNDTLVGVAAGGLNSFGTDNSYFGLQAGSQSDGSYNACFGAQSCGDLAFLNNNTANTAIGWNAGDSHGSNNISVGYKAGLSTTSGSSDIYVGSLGCIGGFCAESNTIRIGTNGTAAGQQDQVFSRAHPQF